MQCVSILVTEHVLAVINYVVIQLTTDEIIIFFQRHSPKFF